MIKSLLRPVRDAVFERLPSKLAIQLEFLYFHHRLPRLDPPVTFSEKVMHRKLTDHDPRMPRLSDKILAKEYVAQTLGNEWIIPHLWSGEHLPPRSERKWPVPFVLKASHGSGWNCFVRCEADLNWSRIEAEADTWLHNVHARHAQEWLYTEIRPMLLVEPYQGTGEIAPTDYKFHIFGGQTAFIQVDLDRYQNHRQLFYDADWKRLPYWYVCPYDEGNVVRPASFEEMIHGAEQLGRDFNYVRVDLYEIGKRPMFGEFTFYPNSGQVSFKPDSVELVLGHLWRN